MGYHQHRADAAHFFQGILNQKLRLRIDIGSCLIQDHNTWFVDDGSRKAQQLTLSGREVISSLPHFLIQTMFQLVNEMIGIHILTDATDFLIRNAPFPQNDVAADRAGEQKYILQHLAKMPAQGSDLDLANVDAVNQNLTLLKLVVAADQG